VEDAHHVWLCQAPAAQHIRATGLNTLSQWMTTTLTSPDVQLTMTTRLQQLFTQQPYTPIPSLPENVQAALETKDSIGWENFFEGCITQDWEAIQDAYFWWCHSRKTGCRWTASLIQKLWDISWDLWEHRIGIVHARENEASLHNMMAVDQEIRLQCIHSPNSLPQCDHHLLEGSLQDILDALIFYRQRWLHRIEITCDRASRHLITTYSAE
jgi:hypothetical protein